MWNQIDNNKPEAEVPVLLLCRSRNFNDTCYVCIGEYYPKGYMVDFCPIDLESEEPDFSMCEFVEDEDCYRFLDDEFMEVCYNGDSSGNFINDQVIGWMPIPDFSEMVKKDVS